MSPVTREDHLELMAWSVGLSSTDSTARRSVPVDNRFGPRGGQGFADRFFTIDRPSVAKLLKHSQTKNNSPGEIIRVCVLDIITER